MAAMKSVFPLVMLIVLVAQRQLITESQAQQTCSSSLASLNVCAPFVVPGGAAPSTDCCTALQTVDRGCLCSTLRIASRIPTQCNLAPLNCGAN